jgi:hypothetical protein
MAKQNQTHSKAKMEGTTFGFISFLLRRVNRLTFTVSRCVVVPHPATDSDESPREIAKIEMND